eukprot:scaffold22278_cov259-Skeletonema_marinoi.AAC.1
MGAQPRTTGSIRHSRQENNTHFHFFFGTVSNYRWGINGDEMVAQAQYSARSLHKYTAEAIRRRPRRIT